MKEHDIYTNQTASVKKKKTTKNKNMCTIFFYSDNSLSPPIFGKLIATIFFPFYFGNTIATNPFSKKNFPSISAMPLPQFFFPSISAMPLTQTNCNNFFSLLFQQCHCHKSIPQFFIFLILKMICTHNFYNIFTTNFKW